TEDFIECPSKIAILLQPSPFRAGPTMFFVVDPRHQPWPIADGITEGNKNTCHERSENGLSHAAGVRPRHDPGDCGVASSAATFTRSLLPVTASRQPTRSPEATPSHRRGAPSGKLP